jgi:hypothetical protein
METNNFTYSLKNIPILDEKSYTISLIEKVEHFIKRIRWKAHFFLKTETAADDEVNNSQGNNNFGFKTKNTPPFNPDLENFENDLLHLIKTIKFQNISNKFQKELKLDIKKIKSNPNILVFADKTSNIYQLTTENYEKILRDNITNSYAKAPKNLENAINLEAQCIAKKLNLENRIESAAPAQAFVTLKDHKPNFHNKLPCRLLVPSKSEIGHVSKLKLDKINNILRKKLNLNQWKNTTDVINWFSIINYKKDCTFIQFDINDFYPSITADILDKTIAFAKIHTDIPEETIRVIKHCRKTLLYFNKETWKKKNINDCFDVTMGSYDGAEICEFVGLYILDLLSKIININDLGLYRDDGLIAMHKKSGPQLDKIRKEIIKIFKNIGFQIEISINLKIVNFLDVTFNLSENSYKPFKKPNDELSYININSNHPPQILKQIPISINNRLNQNSSNENVFNSSKSIYEDALKKSGFQNFELKFDPEKKKAKKRNRTRNIIWFNPPYSKNVTTNIGKVFLKLVDKHFPPSNKLHKIFNRNTIKVSYSCTKNLERIIKGHNNALLNKNDIEKDKKTKNCNCKQKNNCPLDGNCLTKNVVYKCVVSSKNVPDKQYIGLTEGEWKKRFANHKQSFKNRKYSKDTMLSKYIWELKDEKIDDYILNWSILKTAPAYNNISKRCILCLQEKFEIIKHPNQNCLLNKKSELISKCRHENKFLLKNYKNK